MLPLSMLYASGGDAAGRGRAVIRGGAEAAVRAVVHVARKQKKVRSARDTGFGQALKGEKSGASENPRGANPS